MVLEWMDKMDRLEKLMSFLDERNLCALVMLLPQHNGVRISVHQVELGTPILFEGIGGTIDQALDDLIATFQKVGYL